MTKYQISMNESSEEFTTCWQAAGRHLVNQVETGSLKFLRSRLTPPIQEHLSFIIGNQLFFIHVRDVFSGMTPPSGLEACINVAELSKGIPCILDMHLDRFGDWAAAEAGWGLKHAVSSEPINPVELISNEKIEISDYELFDFCVQVVREQIEKEGGEVLNWNSDPRISPSLFFQDAEENVHFVVVCPSRYPGEPLIPNNLSEIKLSVSGVSESGFYAPITVVSADDPFDPDVASSGNFLPLWRGHPYFVKYKQLEAIR